jgi:hypothetical protein
MPAVARVQPRRAMIGATRSMERVSVVARLNPVRIVRRIHLFSSSAVLRRHVDLCKRPNP